MNRRAGIAFDVLIALAFFGAALARPGFFLQDPGTGWHLATGQWMLDHRALPSSDPFSFTVPGAPWLPYEWLFQLGSALLVKVGGLPLLSTLCALVYGATLVHLNRRLLAAGADAITSLGLVLLAVAAFDMHAHARPHAFTYLFLSVLAGRLEAFERQPRNWRLLLPIPFLMILWCNLHAGFMAGLLLIGVHGFVALVQARHAWQAEARGKVQVYFFIGLAALFGSAVNPHGFQLHAHLVEILRMKVLPHWQEFGSPNFNATIPGVWVFEALLLVCLALPAAVRGRLGVLHVVLAVVFAHFALHSVRHILLFILVMLPPLGAVLTTELTWRFPRFQAVAARITGDQLAVRGGTWQVLAIAALFTLASLALPDAAARTLVGPNLGTGAAAHVRRHLTEFTRPLNTCGSGGTLIHEFWPTLHVFFDDRADVYGDRFVQETYLPVERGQPGWREHLERHRVNSAILPANSPLVSLLEKEPGWTSVYADTTNHLFVRTVPQP